jgi:uncharacterized protein (TIGR03067 family)
MLASRLKLVAALTVAVFAGEIAHDGRAEELSAQDDKKAAQPKIDKEAILGTWKVVEVEENGKDASDTDDGKKHKGSTLTITADKAVFKAGDDVLETTYKLDADAKPKTIDLEDGSGRTFNCVYALEGDTLKICAPRRPGENRPDVVATKEGSESFLLVLKREAKESAEKK